VWCGPRLGSALDGICTFADGGGTCFPPSSATGIPLDAGLGLCSEGGGAPISQSCLSGTGRSAGPGYACQAGSVCAVPLGHPGFYDLCLIACDPADPVNCAPEACVAVDPSLTPALGACQPGTDGGVPCHPTGTACVIPGSCCSNDCNDGACK
jgi:hypothetical protein